MGKEGGDQDSPPERASDHLAVHFHPWAASAGCSCRSGMACGRHTWNPGLVGQGPLTTTYQPCPSQNRKANPPAPCCGGHSVDWRAWAWGIPLQSASLPAALGLRPCAPDVSAQPHQEAGCPSGMCRRARSRGAGWWPAHLEAAEALTQVKGDRVQGKQGPEHPVEEKLGAGPTAGSPWAEGRAAEARAGPPLQK